MSIAFGTVLSEFASLKRLGKIHAASFFALGGAVLLGATPGQALTVTASTDAAAMATALLGPGVSLVSGSAMYVGASEASGFFDADTTIFGDPAGVKGVLLTSGSVANALPPNNSTGASRNNGLPGSAQLDSLVGGGTLDASRLDFKVKLDPGTSGIQWKYVFASEEYLEYVNSSFNDVFALYLNGANLALLPGSSTAVSINNVNNGLNSAYYRNNPQSTGIYDTQYDGLTTVLTSVATGLDSNQEYELSFQIADRGDRVLDSGVFIQGESIQDPEIPPDGEAVPGPLPVFGAMMALAASRKLRSRVKKAQVMLG